MNVTIIGSGIVGATAAYYLAKRGVHVTLIDRNEPGRATDAAAGIICPWLAQRRNQAWYELVRLGARTYPALIKQLVEDQVGDPGYQKVGAIGLHIDEKRLLAAKERVLKRKKKAPEIGEVKLLNEDETRKLFPLLEEYRFRSIYISGAARVDGMLLRQALIKGAKKYGCNIVHGDAKLSLNNGEITGVTVGENVFEADFMIVANGAWMRELFLHVGINLAVKPQKAQIIHLGVGQQTDGWPVIMPPNNQYILPFANEKVIIGATHETEAGFDERITVGGVHEILTKALDIVPQFSKATIKQIKVGFRPFTPNSLPVFGFLPGHRRVLIANGLGASGLTSGPLVGMQLGKLILQEKLDLTEASYDIENIL